MREIEGAFPECVRYELFTGAKSAKNLYLYQKLGYKRYKTEKVTEGLHFVYLEKGRVDRGDGIFPIAFRKHQEGRG